MKSQHAGSLFGALVIAVSSSTLLNLLGLEVPYLQGQAAYAVTSQTLEQSISEADSGAEAEAATIQVARRFRSVSR